MAVAAMTDTEFARRAAALAERAERPPPESWRPDDASKGHPEKLIGELVRYEENHTAYGPCRIAVLRNSAGAEFSVWLLHTVLRNEFARLRPKPGELVYVRYLGKRQPKQPGGSPYDAYAVVVDRDDVDWDGSDAGFGERSVGASSPVAPAVAAAACEMCGYDDPDHAADCPNEIPF
jgi:hypothetical protein